LEAHYGAAFSPSGDLNSACLNAASEDWMSAIEGAGSILFEPTRNIPLRGLVREHNLGTKARRARSDYRPHSVVRFRNGYHATSECLKSPRLPSSRGIRDPKITRFIWREPTHFLGTGFTCECNKLRISPHSHYVQHECGDNPLRSIDIFACEQLLGRLRQRFVAVEAVDA
jgi:hypothetical protein